eukprot:TRINITY_DN5782_c0_g1_i1.p1 TRINITY_DN5782_c0_g1~~TRINITY_DN5782_c0_g1_i1.p1  ORF type:complete len:368 (+),score=92.34 TRINITY_DN5782_c0_g1_i1:96-1199(+)
MSVSDGSGFVAAFLDARGLAAPVVPPAAAPRASLQPPASAATSSTATSPLAAAAAVAVASIAGGLSGCSASGRLSRRLARRGGATERRRDVIARRQSVTPISSVEQAAGDAAECPPVFEDIGDWVMEYFCRRLDLKPDEETPEEYSHAVGNKGASLSTRVMRGAAEGCPIRRLRVTLVGAGAEVQAMNVAVYPNPERGALPILGVDIIAMNSGKRLLFGVDWAPASPDEAYHAEKIAPFVDDIKGANEDLAIDPTGKFYGERPEFFSRSMFFARPESLTEMMDREGRLRDVLEGYCERFVEMLERTSPAAPSDASHARVRQDDYDRWHAQRDPALPIFKKLFGEDWTKGFTEQVLFPGSAIAPPSSS